MNIKIGKHIYLTKVAKTIEDRVKGLLGTSSIKKNMGMLLVFDEPGFHKITMVGMKYPLLLVGISKFNEVLQVIPAEVGNNYIFKKKVLSVLEVHPDSKIEEGEEVIHASVVNEGNMLDLHYELNSEGEYFILDQNGNVQVELEGSERIVSRIHTKKLMLLFDAYKKDKTEKNLAAIGSHMVSIINTQDSQDFEYV